MANKVKNQSLGKARVAGEDEFYTQLSDIERELRHYKTHFKGKVVYCNCDDPRISSFLRIPPKANADSEGNANGIPGRRRTDLGA